ncbi:MAG: glutamate racemase [Bacilli bacterium]
MRVGIFDSGIGGLTILKSLIDELPNNEYIYFGDTANLPYGSKTTNQLKTLADKNINFLLSQKVEVIIIACGTISSTIYDEIKENYEVPIIDIINPIVDSLKNTKIKKALLIATEKTIQSKVFYEKLSTVIEEVYTKECPKFVPIIEHKTKDNLDITIAEYLYDFKNQDIEIIIPGCTHYPIIGEEISEYLEIPILDIGLSVASKIKLDYSIKDVKLYFSEINEDLKEVVKDIIGDYEIEEKTLDNS